MNDFARVARTSKRFTFRPTDTSGDYDIYATYRGNDYLIATIRNRQFKRQACPSWRHMGAQDYLPLIQSYAGLYALESGKTGPLP